MESHRIQNITIKTKITQNKWHIPHCLWYIYLMKKIDNYTVQMKIVTILLKKSNIAKIDMP